MLEGPLGRVPGVDTATLGPSPIHFEEELHHLEGLQQVLRDKDHLCQRGRRPFNWLSLVHSCYCISCCCSKAQMGRLQWVVALFDSIGHLLAGVVKIQQNLES